VLLSGLVVTAGALHRGQLLVVRQLDAVEVRVAVDAAELAVHGAGVRGRIDEDGDLFAPSLAHRLRVLVTHETVGVVLGTKPDGRHAEPDQRKDQSQRPTGLRAPASAEHPEGWDQGKPPGFNRAMRCMTAVPIRCAVFAALSMG
jgi:hypothetical protein